MKNKLIKILLILGIFFVMTSILLFWIYYNEEKKLEVTFLDVGQGDSILIELPYGQNVLIDGGPDSSVIRGLSDNLSWWDRNIDLVIMTHPHDDHIVGLIEVLKRYKVEKIIYTGVMYASSAYETLIRSAREKNISLIAIDRIQKINFGEDCGIYLLYPFDDTYLGKETDNLNNSSIVSKLDCRDDKYLFMGDIETDVEKILLEKNINLNSRVLKVGHHGSDTSSSEEFLKEVRAEIAVVTVGEDNKYGHPSLRTLKRIERSKMKIYRTDLMGNINLPHKIITEY